MKHTKGEWNAKGSIVYSLESGKDVARCDIGGRDEETEANARLIASAPELLEALKVAHERVVAMEEAMKEGSPWAAEDQYLTDEACKKVRLAIAKAEGRGS